MTPLGIHHVGVAVTDLDEAIATYVGMLGAALEHRQASRSQGVEAARVVVGSGRVELLAPTGEDTPVGRFLARRGPGMHHIAYEVDDVRAALGDLAAAGAQMIDEQPSTAACSGSKSPLSIPTPSTACSRRSSPMADESIRIEFAFDGGQILAAQRHP